MTTRELIKGLTLGGLIAAIVVGHIAPSGGLVEAITGWMVVGYAMAIMVYGIGIVACMVLGMIWWACRKFAMWMGWIKWSFN